MKLTENRVANPAGVYDPSDASHVKYPGKAQPIVNDAVKRHAKGIQPGRDSLMSTDEYQNGLYARDIKRDSPDRERR